jgi:hypothetical protein
MKTDFCELGFYPFLWLNKVTAVLAGGKRRKAQQIGGSKIPVTVS